jgi:UDP-2,4-diacetamido-2,4,6-trideoxy-beta-L-altropyranose hydrolase
MKIAIKADGGKEIGMGHIMRTMVLAKELNKYHEVFYICNNDEKYRSGRERVEAAGFNIYSNFAVSADILIIDSYDVNEEYFRFVKRYFRYTIYIDDLNSFFHPVDLLINQNINASSLGYTEPNTLLGPNYALLREEFKEISPKKSKSKAYNVLITMGGADPYNLTEVILNYIKSLNCTKHVVIGPAFNNREGTLNINSPSIAFYDNADMKQLMQKCDIAISAFGSTIYELCACGTPTLGIIIVDNQSKVAERFHDIGIIKNLGYHYNIDWRFLENEIKLLSEDYEKRKMISVNMQKLVDGFGVQRIVEHINKNFT